MTSLITPYLLLCYVAGNSLKAVACLNDMRKSNLEPSASHYNLVIRTLRAEVWSEDRLEALTHANT